MEKVGSNTYHILYASDNNYAPIAGVSMTSLFENNQDVNIEVYYLNDNISDLNKDLLLKTAEKYHRNLFFIQIDNYLDLIRQTDANVWFNNSMCAYARLFIGSIFEEKDIDRLLYLDCDTVVDGSISELYDYDLEGCICGAVCDYISVGIRDIIGLNREAPYYNSGVLLVDLKLWRENHTEEKILNHMKNVRAQYPYIDQDIINIILQGKICKLPMKYNVFPYYYLFSLKEIHFMYKLNDKNQYSQEEYDTGLGTVANAVIIHYTAVYQGKPWQIGNDNPAAFFWNTYFEKSQWRNIYEKPVYYYNRINAVQKALHRTARPLYIFVMRIMSQYNMYALMKKYH